MKYDLKELEKEYGKKSVEECVTLAKQWNDQMVKQGEELVGLLWYLEKTARFREFDGYKKQTFKVFVWEVCHIPYNRYRELAYAYNWFPEEAREYGPHTIQTIRGKVGVTNIPKVLKEIKTKLTNIVDPGKKREAIYAVIEKHAPKLPPKVTAPEDTKAYWKQKYDDLMMKYKALEKENEKLIQQIERQKGPVKAFLAMKEAVMPIMQQ